LTVVCGGVKIARYRCGTAILRILAPLRAKEDSMQLTIIVAIVIAIAGVAFAIQNSVPVTVVFILWRFEGSLAMILLLALALGAIVVALVSTPATLRSRWTIKRQSKEIESLNAANAALRARDVGPARQSSAGRSGGGTPAETPDALAPVGLKAIAARFGSAGSDADPKA
jgi:uncharacterized integral membrane protein